MCGASSARATASPSSVMASTTPLRSPPPIPALRWARPGSDVAIHSASVALMSSDLRRVPTLIRISRSARSVIHQNLGLGGLFIIGGLILSGLGLMGPIVAAILHNVGSLLVVMNSARLIRLGEEAPDQA